MTGVSRGLGRCLVETLLKDQYNVFGISSKKNNFIEYLENKYNTSFKFIEFDLLNTENIKNSIFNKHLQNVSLYGLINNAAYAYDDLITNLNVAKLERMYRINVFSAFELTNNFIRNLLIYNVKGKLLHISSISAHTGYKGLSMYASTKGALESFSKNISREWGSKGITSNCVVVGFMETEMSSTLSEEQKLRIYNRTSLKKPTNISSVAQTVNYLLSDNSNSITGQNIFIDCGTI